MTDEEIEKEFEEWSKTSSQPISKSWPFNPVHLNTESAWYAWRDCSRKRQEEMVNFLIELGKICLPYKEAK